MRVGILGTGAIARKHAEAYRKIGFKVTACNDRTAERGKAFGAEWDAEFAATPEELCARSDVDYLDVCTFPAYRLQAVELGALQGKHVLVQKPMAVNLVTARRMIEVARSAGIRLGVMSQHRFDDSVLFLKRAVQEGRLGKILQADAYVKWHRTQEYYARPVKGSWEVEGGGALMNQAIHQADLLLHLVGAASEVFGYWQLGAVHAMESEDLVASVLRYANGAIGVIQASTALWPGLPERIEIHGTKGTAVITGDQLTTWDVRDDKGTDAPIATQAASGASDPMAISLAPFERQFLDFAHACEMGCEPACAGEDGFRALQLVRGIYTSCREGTRVRIDEVSD
jgi:UDP-N-acetyl-2-amino-2-deoxyglucuronate dehydrogenase